MNAFDELRFGPGRTLNLREGLPSAADAVQRAERWLRERQVRGDGEVLIITGRGLHSPGGVGIIRAEVEKLLFSLRRRGVIVAHQAHNQGSFAVQLAPIRSMVEALPRKREPGAPHAAAPLHGLTPETTALLRQLAELALSSLGVRPDESTLEDEMHRQLGAIAPALGGAADLDESLRDVLRSAIEEYD